MHSLTDLLARRAFLGCGLAAVTFSGARAEQDCRLVRHAALDMVPFGGLVVVENAIGDKPLKMLVDTGGYLTCFNESKIAELGLPVERYPESGIVMYGGLGLRRFVTLSDFRIGRMHARRLAYPLLPPGHLPDGIDGLLAPDFLASFDVEFDFAGGKVNLFSKEHCGKVTHWTDQPVTPIALVRDDDGIHISTHVQVDGKDILAIIDTGSSRTIMSFDDARWKFDIDRDDPRLTDDHTFNDLKGTKRFPFQQMTFGNVQVNHPEIILVPDRESRMGPNGPTLILGLSVLRHLHMYIAYREKNLYVTDANEHR
jgi:hypothetical protein